MTRNNLQSNLLKTLKPTKRRGGAEVIASVLLVAITVVGAALLTGFLDEAFVSGSSAETSSTSNIESVRLLAYDTRDSSTLLTVPDLDNKFGDGVLLGAGLVPGNENKLPKDDGTEFLIMQIENQSFNPIFLENINLDGVNHTWDSATSGRLFDGLTGLPNGDYPLDGKFSILPISSPFIQNANNHIASGQKVNLLVKLGTDDTDIPLSKNVRVLLNIGSITPVDFVIESGGAQ